MTLQITDVDMAYGRTRDGAPIVLDNVSLSIEAGEFVTVIGPSGCGKSTLLHCMGGLLRVTNGTITLDGNLVSKPIPDRMSFVFQEYSMLPWLTVERNVAFGLQLAHVPRGRRQDVARQQLKRVGLGDVATKYPRHLSGGMQQRVAIARGLAMEPQVLLLDEPFGALDEMTRRELSADMSAALTESGCCVVMVTHSLDEAVFWGDRVVVMARSPGRIVDVISVDEPRPRPLDFLSSDAFARYRARLFTALADAHSFDHPRTHA